MKTSSSTMFIHLYSVAATVLALITGTLFYLSNKDRDELVQRVDSAEKAEQQVTSALRNSIDDIERMKSALGYGHDGIGAFDGSDATTVLGNLRADLAQADAIQPDPSVNSAIAWLDSERRKLETDREQLISQVNDLGEKLLSLETTWSARLAVENDARKKAEGNLATLIKNKEEIVASKDKAIADYSEQLKELQLQLNTYEEQIKALAKEKADRERVLLATINRMRRTINKIDSNDPNPDAKIVRVNPAFDTVWINIGSRQKLRPGIRFNVYGREQSASQPSKAKIVVVDIKGETLAECRVVKSKIDNPIMSDDWVSSAIWDAGQVHKIAIAGFVDMDGNGISDREVLAGWLKGAGAEVSAYIDDAGQIQGESLDADVRYLVTTPLPEIDSAKTDSARLVAQKTLESFSAMRRAADLYGVQVITIKDFLDKVGYQPTSRLR